MKLALLNILLFSTMIIFVENSYSQEESEPASSAAAAPVGVNKEAIKFIDQAAEQMQQMAGNAQLPGLASSFEAAMKSYQSASESCASKAELADTACIENRSPEVKTVMSGVTAALPLLQAAVGANDTCSKIGDILDLVNKGMLMANAACGSTKALCDMSCASAAKSVTALVTEWERLGAQAKAKANANENLACGQLSSQCPQAELQSSRVYAAYTAGKAALASAQKSENTPTTPPAIASRIKNCTGYAETIVKTGVGLLGVFMSNQTVKDCSEKTATDGTGKCTDAAYKLANPQLCSTTCALGQILVTNSCVAAGEYCAIEANKQKPECANFVAKCEIAANKDTLECYCARNPNATNCKTIAGGQKPTDGSNSSGRQKLTDGSGRGPADFGNLGDSGTTTPGSGGSGTVPSGSGAAPLGGSGMASAPGTSLPGGPEAAGGAGAAGGAEGAAVSGGTGGLGGFNWGSGAGKDSARQILAQKDKDRMAGKSPGELAGVTGPTGKSLWEKVSNRYLDNRPSFLDK